MTFDTKVALIIRTDLAAWQKLNVAAFLASGIAAAYPETVGEPYADASENRYLRLLGQPVFIYGADSAVLTRVLDRALARSMQKAIYSGDMLDAGHDAANRTVVQAVERANLNLVGVGFRAGRKVADKIVDRLAFHKVFARRTPIPFTLLAGGAAPSFRLPVWSG